jgi:exosortase H (IPTLxxWG-CTERM-specific)
MIRFVLLFLVLLLGLFALEVVKPVDEHVILPFTTGLAKISSTIVQFFDADVVSQGKLLQNAKTGFAVQIERGCNGVEAVIILAAAILAFPAPWKHKTLGFLAGFVAIQGLNLVRIISLFYLGQWSQTWFEWFHLYLWQALIIIDALVVFLLWLRWLPPLPKAPIAATPATAGSA